MVFLCADCAVYFHKLDFRLIAFFFSFNFYDCLQSTKIGFFLVAKTKLYYFFSDLCKQKNWFKLSKIKMNGTDTYTFLVQNYVFALCIHAKSPLKTTEMKYTTQFLFRSHRNIYINFVFECLLFDKPTECTKTITKKKVETESVQIKTPRGDKRITMYKLYLDFYFLFSISLHNQINK